MEELTNWEEYIDIIKSYIDAAKEWEWDIEFKMEVKSWSEKLSLTIIKKDTLLEANIWLYIINKNQEKWLSYLITSDKRKIENCMNCFLLEAEDHWIKEITIDFNNLLNWKWI